MGYQLEIEPNMEKFVSMLDEAGASPHEPFEMQGTITFPVMKAQMDDHGQTILLYTKDRIQQQIVMEPVEVKTLAKLTGLTPMGKCYIRLVHLPNAEGPALGKVYPAGDPIWEKV